MGALTEIEVDALSVLEEELVQKGRPYQAYLIRKVLNVLASGWRKTHPQYRFLKEEVG